MNRIYESIKKRHGIEYVYKGLGQLSVFIGPKNDRSKVKQENVMRLLDALDQNENDDLQLYREDRNKLVPMLTEGMEREYLQKRAAAVQAYRAAFEEEIRRLQEEEITNDLQYIQRISKELENVPADSNKMIVSGGRK